MKEKLKYNFLCIISLHCSKFYNCFSLYCAQGSHFFCNTKCSTKAILSGPVTKLKIFHREFPFCIAIIFSKKNLLMCKKVSNHFQFCPKNLGEDYRKRNFITSNRCPKISIRH